MYHLMVGTFNVHLKIFLVDIGNSVQKLCGTFLRKRPQETFNIILKLRPNFLPKFSFLRKRPQETFNIILKLRPNFRQLLYMRWILEHNNIITVDFILPGV